MRNLLLIKYVGLLLLIFSTSCIREEVTVERLVCALWSADNSEILKIYSLYETDHPLEVYYYAPSGKNWRYRFEVCDTNLLNSRIVGYVKDKTKSGSMAGFSVYWLSEIQKVATNCETISMDGTEKALIPPKSFTDKVYANANGYFFFFELAPSPNDEIIAVYYQTYILWDIYYQHISFFDSKTGNHIFSQEIPLHNKYLALQGEEGRHNFLWSKEGNGVYLVSRNISYFISCVSPGGIWKVDSVPEHCLMTRSGYVSRSGKRLKINLDGNKTSLEVVQEKNWVPFDQNGMIPQEKNDYSFY